MLPRPPRSTLFPYTSSSDLVRRELKVPAHFSRVRVQRDDGVREQVVARTLRRVQIRPRVADADRKSTRLNSSHSQISYAVFCLKKKGGNMSKLLGRQPTALS